MAVENARLQRELEALRKELSSGMLPLDNGECQLRTSDNTDIGLCDKTIGLPGENDKDSVSAATSDVPFDMTTEPGNIDKDTVATDKSASGTSIIDVTTDKADVSVSDMTTEPGNIDKEPVATHMSDVKSPCDTGIDVTTDEADNNVRDKTRGPEDIGDKQESDSGDEVTPTPSLNNSVTSSTEQEASQFDVAFDEHLNDSTSSMDDIGSQSKDEIEELKRKLTEQTALVSSVTAECLHFIIS